MMTCTSSCKAWSCTRGWLGACGGRAGSGRVAGVFCPWCQYTGRLASSPHPHSSSNTCSSCRHATLSRDGCSISGLGLAAWCCRSRRRNQSYTAPFSISPPDHMWWNTHSSFQPPSRRVIPGLLQGLCWWLLPSRRWLELPNDPALSLEMGCAWNDLEDGIQGLALAYSPPHRSGNRS